MTKELNSEARADELVAYQIRIRGHLGVEWAEWFGGMTVTLDDNGDTVLTGRVADQTALYGLLRRVRDLGISLVSINRVELVEADAPDLEPPGAI